MPQNASEATMAYFPETTFGVGPADWDNEATAVVFTAIEPNWSGLRQSTVDNRSMRRRAYATLPKLLGLRNDANFTFGLYASGSGATTAANSAADSFCTADLMQCAWGGLHLGYASAIVGASTTEPEITADQGANHPAGAPIFAVDANGAGQFSIVDGVSTDTLTLRVTLTATPASIGAAIACFPHTRALSNRAHASHTTLSFLFRGEDTDDNYLALGCKLNVAGLEQTEAGGDASWTFEGLAATFEAETLDHADLDDTPQAPTGPIVGRAGTGVRIANVGTASMPDVGAYSFSFTPGIASQRVGAVVPGGVAGYHGGGYDDTMLEITVPYDDAWMVDFRAGTRKHILIQVGDQRGDAYGIYLPNAELAEDPERGVSADETAITLRFRALEYPGTTHTEGDDEYELERAKFLVLMAA